MSVWRARVCSVRAAHVQVDGVVDEVVDALLVVLEVEHEPGEALPDRVEVDGVADGAGERGGPALQARTLPLQLGGPGLQPRLVVGGPLAREGGVDPGESLLDQVAPRLLQSRRCQ